MCNRAKQLARLASQLDELSQFQLDEVERLVARLELVPDGTPVLRESDDEASHSRTFRRRIGNGPRRIALLLLIGFFALANLLVPGLFWNAGASDFLQNAAFFCVGGLVAQAYLLASWGAMAAVQMKYRIPISAGLVLVAACSYLLGLQLPDFPNSDFPLLVALFLVGLGVAGYLVLLLPLWLVRRLTQMRIALPCEDLPEVNEQSSAQFGLRYLLMCPVVVSGVIILLQYSLPEDQSRMGPGVRDILEILFGAGVFAAFSMLICIPCIWLALADRRRWLWGIGLGLVWLGGPWCIVPLLKMQYGMPNTLEPLLHTGSYATGLLATTLLVLFIFRYLGYRLVGRPAANPFATEVLERGDSPSSCLSGGDNLATTEPAQPEV